jgi:peptidoglycan/LPS O-acetylase OafA/YrhL
MRSSPLRIPSLDLFRGIAVACVFLHHCLEAAFGASQLPWAGWTRDFSFSPGHRPLILLYPLTVGWWGVSVFFVISGFCIHLSANRQAHEGMSGFFTRRFFRIYPPYLAALLFFALVWPWTRTSLHSDSGRMQIASHALLVHNFVGEWFFGINPSFWSIAVGAQLYVIYPLLLLCVSRWTWRKTIVFLAIGEATLRLNFGIYFWLTGQHPPSWLSANPFVYWFSWALGALLAEAHLRERTIPLADLSPWVWTCAFLLTSVVRPLSDLGFFFGAMLAANLLARQLTASAPAAGRALSTPATSAREPRWKRHLHSAGLWSFSIYLVHEPLLEAFSRTVSPRLAGVPGGQWLVFLANAGLWFAIVPLGALLYRWVELPSIALGEKFLRPASAQ